MKDKEFLVQLALGTFDPDLLRRIVENSKNLPILTAAVKYFVTCDNDEYENNVCRQGVFDEFLQNKFLPSIFKKYLTIAHQIKYSDNIDIAPVKNLKKAQNKLNKLHSQLFKD